MFVLVLLLIGNEKQDDSYKHAVNSVRNQADITLIPTLKNKSGKLSIAYQTCSNKFFSMDLYEQNTFVSKS